MEVDPEPSSGVSRTKGFFTLPTDFHIGQASHRKHPPPRDTVLDRSSTSATMSTPMNDAMQASVLRLLEAMHRPVEAAVLGAGLLRELYFRVLTGAQGGSLREALAMRGQFGQIGRSLRLIHSSYSESLDVRQLADEAGMGIRGFHSHFKAITQVSPMQYVKSTRRHQARLLMVRNELTAEAAGHTVGYRSTSQFSREFRRLFGLTPAAEAKRMRESFTIPAAFADTAYVSSH
jgi:AraC-like DNA-binding protein